MYHYFHYRLTWHFWLLTLLNIPFLNLLSVAYSSAAFGQLQMKHSMTGTQLTNNGYTFSFAYFKSIITGKLFLPHSSYTNCSDSIPECSTSLFFGEGMFHLESEWPPQEARCYLSCKSHQFDKVINHCRKIPQWALSSTSDIWQPNTSGQPACSRWASAAAEQNLPLLPHHEPR